MKKGCFDCTFRKYFSFAISNFSNCHNNCNWRKRCGCLTYLCVHQKTSDKSSVGSSIFMATMTRDRGHSNEQFIYRFAYIFIYCNFIYQVGQYMQPIYMHFLFLFFFNCFFLWNFFLLISICYLYGNKLNMYTIHNHSTTIYIYIFNLIVHASYFEAFFIIGWRLNSILSTQL